MKSVSGVDCPGCGFQRAIVELFKGNFMESIDLYPALMPMMITFLILGLFLKFRFTNGLKVLMISFSITVLSIIVSYSSKMYHLLEENSKEVMHHATKNNHCNYYFKV